MIRTLIPMGAGQSTNLAWRSCWQCQRSCCKVSKFRKDLQRAARRRALFGNRWTSAGQVGAKFYPYSFGLRAKDFWLSPKFESDPIRTLTPRSFIRQWCWSKCRCRCRSWCSCSRCKGSKVGPRCSVYPVSYTHLTLPTKA